LRAKEKEQIELVLAANGYCFLSDMGTYAPLQYYCLLEKQSIPT
jgi:hypothetical protein